MLTLGVESHSDLVVLRCSGRILRGDGSDTLLRTVMSQETRNIRIDLRDVEAIDASGLGTLATLEKWAADQDRALTIANPAGIVREAIEATHLHCVLQVSEQTSSAAA